MKIVYKKKKKLKESKDLPTTLLPTSSESTEDEAPNILRKYLEEINSMAERLIVMQDEIKDIYNDFREKDMEFPYYPGFEFRHAARQLADREKFDSLASTVSRSLENYIKLKGPHFQRLRDEFKTASEKYKNRE